MGESKCLRPFALTWVESNHSKTRDRPRSLEPRIEIGSKIEPPVYSQTLFLTVSGPKPIRSDALMRGAFCGGVAERLKAAVLKTVVG